MTHYLVISPAEVCYYDGGGEAGLDPPEYGPCVVTVEAPNKRAARGAALRHPDMAEWVTVARGDERNPFSGLEVVDMTCPHGYCCCELCSTEDGPGGGCPCPECAAELDGAS